MTEQECLNFVDNLGTMVLRDDIKKRVFRVFVFKKRVSYGDFKRIDTILKKRGYKYSREYKCRIVEELSYQEIDEDSKKTDAELIEEYLKNKKEKNDLQ